jgi:hypothetical protein
MLGFSFLETFFFVENTTTVQNAVRKAGLAIVGIGSVSFRPSGPFRSKLSAKRRA